MKILAFDTTLQRCSAALIDLKTNHTTEEEQNLERGHSEALPHMIDNVMKKTHVSVTQLDRIAVTIGPGSFTGVRIGIALARAIACAAEKPLIGLSTLEAIAANYTLNATSPTTNPIISTIKSGKDFCYWQCFTPTLTPLTEAAILNTQNNADIQNCTQKIKKTHSPHKSAITLHIVGTGAHRFMKALSPMTLTESNHITLKTQSDDADSLPHARIIALRSASLNPSNTPPNPIYLRKADAKLPASPHNDKIRL